ncbi:NAD(P)H-dependent flavin oxidoreductase [Rouxiella sp. Mn2063]
MESVSFNTPIIDLFGIRLPIVAGGLMWLSDANYVAAASRAGVMGFITAASFPELPALRAEIRRCRELCQGGSFGVNVSMLPKLVEGEQTQAVFAAIAEEGVRFVETSGRSPEAYLPMLHSAGIKVLHKVPNLRFAIKAAELGVDAVSIVGAECGGHPGLDLIGSFVQAAWAKSHITLPYLIGGGVGEGSQIAAALAMGASGVVIGTRFLVAEEIWAHADYKRQLIASQPTDTQLCMQSIRNTVRVLRNQTSEAVVALEASMAEVRIEDLLPLVSGKIGRNAYATGDWSQGLLSAGQSLAFVDRIEPVASIVSRLEQELLQALERLHRIAGEPRQSTGSFTTSIRKGL